jgi:hypothetical protein
MDLINQIQKEINLYFEQTKFVLKQTAYNTFIVEGNSTAINHIRKDKEQINVIHWFDSYWVYFEIKFVDRFDGNKKKYPQIFLSTSIFEGDVADSKKIQLFRAEWDNHDDNTEHPQPHWHIYPFDSFEEYGTFKELISESQKDEGFMGFVEQGQKIVDLSKFHFAMNGQWYIDNGHITYIDNDTSLIKWVSGVFGHIQTQLRYCNR